mmetsp:Transcript_26234/g.44743  ORF Transcript_26234/g.44743 Transcript_26234/m.44743 type:complete len:153 (-) Transcript_26234:389-847(-)
MASAKLVVKKKPAWLGGVILPTLIGIPLGYLLQNTAACWYALAGWQIMFAIAMVKEVAAQYGAGSIPQARRVAELYGLNWFGMAAVTLTAMNDLPGALAVKMLAFSMICTYGFSIAAGPTRLTNANKNEMWLVPTNSFIVGWAAATLFFVTI